MNKDPLVFVRHILMFIENVGKDVQGYSKERFLRSRKTQDAVIRNIELLGEAARNIPAEFQQQYPDIPWAEMIRTRDKLIHGYFGVDLEIVWGVVIRDLPSLKEKIKKVLK
jgi:uncharacterized protein with HEPN domain